MLQTTKTAIGEIIAAQRALDSVHHHATNPAIKTAHARLDAAFTLMLRSSRSEHYRLSAYAGTFGPELRNLENARNIAQSIADHERIPVTIMSETDTPRVIVHPREFFSTAL